ncbi:MAG: hypothetical protein JWO71_4391 [Candidatus Acidoferrum typicum]|nr:hypothetical protein [Candidatus Acidoferrum typicum]
MWPVAGEAEVRDQDSVWAEVFLAGVAERAGPAVEAPVRADQAAGVEALAAPEAEVAARWMPEICGARQGKGAVAVVAEAPALAVEVLAVVQMAWVDPEEVAEARAASEVEAAPDQAASSEVASEVEAAPDQVAAEVARQEVLSRPAALRANG